MVMMKSFILWNSIPLFTMVTIWVCVHACICVFKRERFHCLCVWDRETSPTPVKLFPCFKWSRKYYWRKLLSQRFCNGFQLKANSCLCMLLPAIWYISLSHTKWSISFLSIDIIIFNLFSLPACLCIYTLTFLHVCI